MADFIEGLILIRHNVRQIDRPDNESYPYKLKVDFRPHEFMEFAFTGLYGGSESLVLRGMTLEAIEEFMRHNHMDEHHPRLGTITVTGPEGVIREIKKAE